MGDLLQLFVDLLTTGLNVEEAESNLKVLLNQWKLVSWVFICFFLCIFYLLNSRFTFFIHHLNVKELSIYK